MALQIDDDGNIYDDGVDDGNSGNEIVYDHMPVSDKDYDFWKDIGINPDTTMENWKSPSNEEIEKAIQGDYNFAGLIKQYGKAALDLLKTNGKYDPKKLLALGGGLLAANKSNAGPAPTGYQGKIPKLTATSNMLTAPPVGRRPGSGGINYGGGVTYRDDKGNVVSSNEKTLEELRQAAINNPFNRGSTYEGQSNLGQSDLAALLALLNPPKAPTAPTTPAPVTPTTPSPTTPTTPVGSGGSGVGSTAPTGSSSTSRPSATATSSETVALRQQLRDEYTKGPKTQEQLDKLLLKYPPAVMRAEFPEFGNTADYNNATREAYARTEQQQRIGNREAMRADMAGKGEEFRIANPGGYVQLSSPPFPTMSAIPQWELDAARAKLTPEQAAVIDWRLAQVNPMTGQRVADDYARQGTNPYSGNAAAQAQEIFDKGVRRTDLLSQAGVSTAGIAPWTDPNWRATQQAKEDAERARMDKQTADWLQIPEAQRPVAGPGASTAAPSGYGNYLDKQMYTAPTATGGIMDWYNANVGRTDDRAQADLTNFLKNSGYNANQLATALPQWSERDLELAGAPPAPKTAPEVGTAAPQQTAPQQGAPAAAPAAPTTPAAPAAPVAAAPAAPATPAAPVVEAPVYAPTPEEIASWGYAKGGLARDGFVVPADVVSHFGNGSSEAGLKLLAQKIGATPIKGDGDGMSDSIKTKIDGVQEARVANDEAYVSPEMVAKLGNGSPEKGARKLYAMMDKIRKARTGSTEQGKEIDPNKYMPGGSVQRYAVGGATTPTGATGSESSLSNWAGDYVTNMLGQGAALANKPYEAYTGPLTAGSSQLQNQAFNMASNLQTPGSIGQAAGTAGGIANLAANMRYTPQTTDFLGGANMSGLGMSPSYGVGMPQQPSPMGTYNNPIPMPRPGITSPNQQGPSADRLAQKEAQRQMQNITWDDPSTSIQRIPGTMDYYHKDPTTGEISRHTDSLSHTMGEGLEVSSVEPSITRDPGYAPKDPNYGRGVDAEGREFFRLPDTSVDFGPDPLQKPRPGPMGGMESFQTKPFQIPSTGGNTPLPFEGGAPEMPQYGQPIQTGSRPGLRDLVTMDPSNPMYDTMYNYMQAGREQGAAGRPLEGFQTKPFQVESSEPSMQNGAMTGGTMRPPSQDAGLPGLMRGQQGMQAQQPQASQQVGNIAQQYMNPYLESALRPQMAEMQRAADIARMSDAARLTQAGAFGGSRQAIMESEGRRNLLGKQSDALAQGYSTAYDKAMAQFNADQARRAQEAQFGATFGLQGLQTGIQGAQTQGQLGAQQSQADINNLRATLEAGGVQRGIESEGIAADKAQFEEARLNPYKMLQFQQSLLSGMPLASQSYSIPGQSNLQQFAGGATTIAQLLDILSGKTPAAAKP